MLYKHLLTSDVWVVGGSDFLGGRVADRVEQRSKAGVDGTSYIAGDPPQQQLL